MSLLEILKKPPSLRSADDIQKIFQATQKLQFFKKLKSDQTHQKLCKAMTLQVFNQGEDIVTFGSLGDKFYIIIQGKTSVLVPQTKTITSNQNWDFYQEKQQIKKFFQQNPQASEFHIQILKKVGELGQSQAFGELALITNKARAATIRAFQFTATAVLTNFEFNNTLAKLTAQRLYQQAKQLKNFPLFRQWTLQSLLKISYYLKTKSYRKKQRVYQQTDPVKYVYFVKEGEFRLGKTLLESSEKLIKTRNSRQFLSPIKLRNIKQKYTKKPIFFNIKGKNEILGQQEVLESQPLRQNYCECISSTGEVLFMRKNQFIKRVSNSKSWKNLISVHNQTSDLRSERFLQQKRVQRGLDKEFLENTLRIKKKNTLKHDQKLSFKTLPSLRLDRTPPPLRGTSVFEQRISFENLIKHRLTPDPPLPKFYQKKLFARKEAPIHRFRKIAPPNFLLSVRRGLNLPQKCKFPFPDL